MGGKRANSEVGPYMRFVVLLAVRAVPAQAGVPVLQKVGFPSNRMAGRQKADLTTNHLKAKAWVKLALRREESSGAERPMVWAWRYSVVRSVWNMVGSSVERVMGMPWRRSWGRG